MSTYYNPPFSGLGDSCLTPKQDNFQTQVTENAGQKVEIQSNLLNIIRYTSNQLLNFKIQIPWMSNYWVYYVKWTHQRCTSHIKNNYHIHIPKTNTKWRFIKQAKHVLWHGHYRLKTDNSIIKILSALQLSQFNLKTATTGMKEETTTVIIGEINVNAKVKEEAPYVWLLAIAAAGISWSPLPSPFSLAITNKKTNKLCLFRIMFLLSSNDFLFIFCLITYRELF